ncbi:MAG TPA: hypothetical protein PLK77_08410 [Pyrinomonadaceae bacterium]|nr:hypothetical protein [Pyrinomonadaceae bacterium]
MLTQVEAEVGVDGSVVLLEPLRLKRRSRAIVTIIDEGENTKRSDMPKERDGLREMFGSISLGRSIGLNNDEIDADLAKEYGGGE